MPEVDSNRIPALANVALPEGGPLEEWTTLRLRYIGLSGQLVFFLTGDSATGYLNCFCFIESYLKWLGLTEPP